MPGVPRDREEDGQGGNTAGASGHPVGWDITRGQGEHSATSECGYGETGHGLYKGLIIQSRLFSVKLLIHNLTKLITSVDQITVES